MTFSYAFFSSLDLKVKMLLILVNCFCSLFTIVLYWNQTYHPFYNWRWFSILPGIISRISYGKTPRHHEIIMSWGCFCWTSSIRPNLHRHDSIQYLLFVANDITDKIPPHNKCLKIEHFKTHYTSQNCILLRLKIRQYDIHQIRHLIKYLIKCIVCARQFAWKKEHDNSILSF